MNTTKHKDINGIHGSYDPEDVTFLLKEVSFKDVEISPEEAGDKETLIQTGQRHYCEMIAPENIPGEQYISIFNESMAHHGSRMAIDIARLAWGINNTIRGPITLVSLVRAGTPIGVLLKKTLLVLGRDVEHYGVSIIRGRGLDINAMNAIVQERPAAGVVFVDGWTGKGAITDELHYSLSRKMPGVPARLVVLADPAGRAWMSASFEDWLIPSGILGGTVSGLISRSILNEKIVGPLDYHATVIQKHLEYLDVTKEFIEKIFSKTKILIKGARGSEAQDKERDQARRAADRAIDVVSMKWNISNLNRIKPGIAEATRAVLRRAPGIVLVSKKEDPDVAGIIHLANIAGVDVQLAPEIMGPYRAITIIKDLSGKNQE